jgi:Phosphatidylethanolamine-binding protein
MFSDPPYGSTSAAAKGRGTDGDYLPNDFILSAGFGFKCAGGNKSPHLKWSGAPQETQNFAITYYDPDGPLAPASGIGWWSTSRRILVNSPKALVAQAARCLRARCRHAPISVHPGMAARARQTATIRTGLCSWCLP